MDLITLIKNNPEGIYDSRNQRFQDWDWRELSRNLNITWEIVQNNPNKNWNWSWLSTNPNITWEIVQNNPDKNWDWNELPKNPNITWTIVQNNFDKPWNWGWLSENKFSHYFEECKFKHLKCYQNFPYVRKKREIFTKELLKIFGKPGYIIGQFVII